MFERFGLMISRELTRIETPPASWSILGYIARLEADMDTALRQDIAAVNGRIHYDIA